MVSIQVKAKVGPDGVLRLQVPTNFRDVEVDACLVLNPSTSIVWPPGFFEATAGRWVGELERGRPGQRGGKRLAGMTYLPDTNVCIA